MSLRLISFTRPLLNAALALSALTNCSLHAQSYVNVSVGGVFSPGVYGQVTFGNAPPPPVYNPRPVVIAPMVVGAPVVYMHVPEKHRQRWSHYCDRYNACGYPVQFVQVNVGYRWWEDRGMYRYGDRHDHNDDRGRHDNGRHRDQSKHHRDD